MLEMGGTKANVACGVMAACCQDHLLCLVGRYLANSFACTVTVMKDMCTAHPLLMTAYDNKVAYLYRRGVCVA